MLAHPLLLTPPQHRPHPRPPRPAPAVRSESAGSLGHYGPDAAPAIHPLAAALADEYLDVRLSAAEALATLGPTARPALPALRQAAESSNELLRDTARQALGRIE